MILISVIMTYFPGLLNIIIPEFLLYNNMTDLGSSQQNGKDYQAFNKFVNDLQKNDQNIICI